MDIIDILNKENIEYKTTNINNEINIKCTSGLHEDNSPSLQYNLEKNLFHCWSCGFSGGSSKFLESIGIATKLPLETKQPYKIKKLKEKLKEKVFFNNFSLPKDRRPAYETFKGVSPETLKEFDSFYTSEHGLEDYVCIPVYQFGRIRFIEGRARFPNKKPKYYRQPSNAQSSDVLFPIDKITDKKHLILVEGIFDMLNLWSQGYTNTVCIFGTSNFNNKKIDVLEKLGTTNVTLMMDGDDSGRRASKKISSMLEKIYIQTNIINLPEGRDPGDLSQAEIKVLLEEN